MLTAYLIVQTIALMKTLKVTKWQIASLLAIFVAFVATSVTIQNGGLLLYGEADWFLIDHNTSERPLWNKILTPHRHDAEQYLARELTHIVEHVDARFIHACTLAGHPHFLSIMTYVFLCGVCFLFWLVARHRQVDQWLTFLLIALFLTAPPIMLAGSYVRPGHAHATFWAVALVLWLYVKLKVRFSWAITFGLALAMVWADRQGLFMAVVLIATLVTIQWLRRDPLGDEKMSSIMFRIKAAQAIVAATVLHSIYAALIGPVLIENFTTFKVGANYQGDVISSLIPTIWRNGWAGLLLALNNVCGLVGNVSLGVGAAVVAACCWAFGRRWWMPLAWFVLAAIMYALILFHQTALMWPDLFSTAYYLIFATAMAWLVAAHVITFQSARWDVWDVWDVSNIIHVPFRNYARWIIAGMILGNLGCLPGHLNNMKRGHLSGFIAGAPFLKEALREAVNQPQQTNTSSFDIKASMNFTEFKHVMKNPLEYGGKLTAKEFVESSQYLQWVRSERGLTFGKGGRE